MNCTFFYGCIKDSLKKKVNSDKEKGYEFIPMQLTSKGDI